MSDCKSCVDGMLGNIVSDIGRRQNEPAVSVVRQAVRKLTANMVRRVSRPQRWRYAVVPAPFLTPTLHGIPGTAWESLQKLRKLSKSRCALLED